MTSDNKSDASQAAEPLEKGRYHRGGPSDARGPCPMINSLANHGYLPRDGRNIHEKEVHSAMKYIGLSQGLATLFSAPVFFERPNQDGSQQTQRRSFLSMMWFYIHNPLAILFSKNGMRPGEQIDKSGTPYIHADQLAIRDTVEHDISLTRRDFAQGDNHSPQTDLIEGLLQSSSDGEYVSMEDLNKFRTHRIETQKKENKEVNYGAQQHHLACGESALLLTVIGDGQKIKRDYLKALFAEERLPLNEGWEPKRSQPVGVLAIQSMTKKVSSSLGLKF